MSCSFLRSVLVTTKTEGDVFAGRFKATNLELQIFKHLELNFSDPSISSTNLNKGSQKAKQLSWVFSSEGPQDNLFDVACLTTVTER